MTTTIATWNVNSVRSRLQHLVDWLRADKPDVVLLQELKCQEEQFPRIEVEDCGYNIALHGQKTYNGVAILSRFPLEDITRGLPTFPEDANARYIEALVNVNGKMLRVASVYVPNGSEVGSDKYQYKLQFLEKFQAHCRALVGYQESLIIGGDFNIAPTDIDVHNPNAWQGSVLTHEDLRAHWRKIINTGLHDAGALQNNHHYSWWDYRAGGFIKNDGLRIDHLLLSSQAADGLQHYEVKKNLRALEKPSDHAPVVVSIK